MRDEESGRGCSGEEAPGQLLANPANWRIHPKAQQDALAGALDQVGWVQQVMVTSGPASSLTVMRVALAISRNEPSVPVLTVRVDRRPGVAPDAPQADRGRGPGH
jgi:hypothetical protein